MTQAEEMAAVRALLVNEMPRGVPSKAALLRMWAAVGGPGYQARNETPKHAATWTSAKFGWQRVKQ